jgi:hypothetical protein
VPVTVNEVFLRLLDELSEWHLALLEFLGNPVRWYEARGLDGENGSATLDLMAARALPHITDLWHTASNQEDDARALVIADLARDLERHQLVEPAVLWRRPAEDYVGHPALHDQDRANRLRSHTTPKGRAFLKFVSDPLHDGR